jgi:hypothetical protein
MLSPVLASPHDTVPYASSLAMFRYGTSSSRTSSLTPPSAYPGRLSPVGSDDQDRGVSRRVSRTNFDFEQALQNGDTVKLREGPDISLLGITDSPGPPKHSQFSTPSKDTPRFQQPATPTVIPPTPELGSSQAQSSVSHSLQSPSSRHPGLGKDLETQSKRRSVLRSPGTASSPDLATLIKKAKDKSRAEAAATSTRDNLSNTQPSASGLSSGNRPRSSTQNHGSHSPSSYHTQADGTATLKGKGKAPGSDTFFSRTASSQVAEHSMRMTISLTNFYRAANRR